MTDDTNAHVELRRSFSWRTIAAAAGLLSTFGLSVVVVRTLEPREAATFYAILAALSIGPLIGRLGLGLNAIRLIPMECDPESRRLIAASHLHAVVLLSVVSAPVIALLGCIGLRGHSIFVPAVIMTALLVAVESVRLMVSDIFAATGRVGASVATMHYVRSFMVLPFVAFIVFVVGNRSLIAVLATYVAVAATQLVVALIYARRDVAMFNFSPGTSLRAAVGQGTQLFSLEFSEFMMMQGTIWLATSVFAALPATQYAAAVTLAMQVTILEGLLSLAATPAAARLWAAGKVDQVARTLSNVATASTLIAVVVVGLIAVGGHRAIEIAYGEDMRPAGTLLLILAVGGVFRAALTVNITMLIVSGHIAAAARTAVAVLALALPCAVAAALFGDPMLLTVVTSASVAVMLTGQYLTARKYVGVAPHAHFHVVRAMRELLSDSDVEEDTVSVQRGRVTE